MVTDYSYGLESPVLNAGPWTCAAMWLDFDYKLVDRNATGDELLSVEIFYNGSWHQKVEFANNGSVDWTPQHIDISAVQGKALKVRFLAYGANSADILHWYVDNIHVYGICNSPVDLDYTQSQFSTTLTWTAPECTGGGASTPIDFIFDDGSAENGWAINPGYLAWLGNEFPIAPTYEGVLQSFDVWFGFNPSTSMQLTLDVYDGAQNLVGSSDAFTAPYEDWLTVNVNDIPFSGMFYGMIKWNNLSGATNYLGFDEDGPYAQDNLGWYYDGSTWEKISIAGGGNPGVFLLRAHALVGGDLKEVTLVPSRQSGGVITSSPAITGIDGYFDTKNYGTLGVSDNLSDSSQIVGYNVWRTDETGTGPFTKLNGAPVTATTYVDTYPSTLEAGTFDYYVTAVYNDSQTGTFLCESPGSDTVEVEFPAIGINEAGSGSIVIFPNPATEVVNVKSDATIATIEVMNFVGQAVYNVNNVASKTAKINVTTLTSGVYFVKVTTDQGIRTAKITVTR